MIPMLRMALSRRCAAGAVRGASTLMAGEYMPGAAAASRR